MSGQNILRSTALLTLSGIIAKTVDFLFRAYYSTRLSSEGMGLFSLVFSFHGLILTFATAGLGVAVSKTVSQQYAAHSLGSIKRTMSIALTSVSLLSTTVIILVFLFSKQLASSFLKEPRTEKSILMLAPSILFMGLSYCTKGYFYASRKILIPASSEFLEQLVKIISIILLLNRWLPQGVEQGCQAVFLGITIGEFSSCLYLLIFFGKSASKLSSASTKEKVSPSLFSIAFPAMLSSLSGAFLRMQEDVFIVSGLRKSGLDSVSALSQYGIIKGMVMPLVIFPLTLLSSCFTLLVPEISRAEGMKNSSRLKSLIGRIYRFTAFGGFLICTIYVAFSKELSEWVYSAPHIENSVKIISLLMPIMFIDSVSCGILGGMGKQSSLLFFGIMDSVIRLVLIWQLVPRFGINALFFIIIISNLFTAYHTFTTAVRSAKLSFDICKWFLRHSISFAAALVSLNALSVFFNYGDSFINSIWAMCFTVLTYALYSSCLYKTLRSDLSWLTGRMFSGG